MVMTESTNEQGRDASRGRLQLVIIIEMCVNHCAPKTSPGDSLSTHETDGADINYLPVSAMSLKFIGGNCNGFYAHGKLTSKCARLIEVFSHCLHPSALLQQTDAKLSGFQSLCRLRVQVQNSPTRRNVNAVKVFELL